MGRVNNTVDNKIKYLEMIQSVISRMGGNSFKIKGWAITVIGALYAFWVSQDNFSILFLVLAVIFVFWLLDAYYLSLEREFRILYDKVIQKNEEDKIDFKMDTSKITFRIVFTTAKSMILLITYGTASLITVMFLLFIPLIKFLKLIFTYYWLFG